jgi:hypothetical protein
MFVKTGRFEERRVRGPGAVPVPTEMQPPGRPRPRYAAGASQLGRLRRETRGRRPRRFLRPGRIADHRRRSQQLLDGERHRVATEGRLDRPVHRVPNLGHRRPPVALEQDPIHAAPRVLVNHAGQCAVLVAGDLLDPGQEQGTRQREWRGHPHGDSRPTHAEEVVAAPDTGLPHRPVDRIRAQGAVNPDPRVWAKELPLRVAQPSSAHRRLLRCRAHRTCGNCDRR